MVVEFASLNVVFRLLSAIGVFVPDPEVFLGQAQVGTYTCLINDLELRR